MNIEIREAQQFDIEAVVARSRHASSAEAIAVLDAYIRRSIQVWMGTVDGEIACVWGILSPTLLSDRVYIWLLHTDLAEQHAFLFVRHSQRWIEDLLKIHPTIVGHCVIGNKGGMRWLKWLGARFEPPQRGLLPFVIEAKHG